MGREGRFEGLGFLVRFGGFVDGIVFVVWGVLAVTLSVKCQTSSDSFLKINSE
jgi:hypothetical protein